MIDNLAKDLWPTRMWTMQSATEFGFDESSDVLEGLRSRVMLYNDEIHTFDEVAVQLVKAVGCSMRDAALAAWAAHVHGRVLIFEGEMMECLVVSSVLEEIALQTQVLT